MTDNARAEFEKWAEKHHWQWFGGHLEKMRSGDYDDIRTRAAWIAWQARDAYWREKLESGEMVEKCAIAAENAKVERIIEEQKLHQRAGGDIVVVHERIAFRKTRKTIARAVLAAILEEMK